MDGVVLLLVRLPGHLPYYTAAASIVTKTYSNSMMAVLNSRVKPVSNAPSFKAPFWNELSGKRIESMHSAKSKQGILFFRHSGAGFTSSRGSDIALP